MPVKNNSKRKSSGGDRDSADAKKSRREENMKLFEKMKAEAAAKTAKAEANRAANKKKEKDRRTTIVTTSSSRVVTDKVKKPSRASMNSRKPVQKPPTPPIISGHISTSESEDDGESSGEDEFDRLTQGINRHSVGLGREETPSENEYAKVYTRPNHRPGSRQQNDFLQRQKELFDKSQREYHSFENSDESEEDEVEEVKEVVRAKKSRSAYAHYTEKARARIKKSNPEMTYRAASKLISAEWKAMSDSEKKVYAEQTSPASLATKKNASPQSKASSFSEPAPVMLAVGKKDDMMVQIDTILLSIASFFLGVLLVVGVYFSLTSLDLTPLFTSIFGIFFTDLSGHVQSMAKRVALLTIVLSIVFCGLEAFLWFNRRANSRKQVIAHLANDAKALIKVKLLYPTDYIMEEVLDDCGHLTLNGAKMDRSIIKSLWADVEATLLEDARMQSSDQMFEGKRRRCLRYGGGLNSQQSPSSSLLSGPGPSPAVAANPAGRINLL